MNILKGDMRIVDPKVEHLEIAEVGNNARILVKSLGISRIDRIYSSIWKE